MAYRIQDGKKTEINLKEMVEEYVKSQKGNVGFDTLGFEPFDFWKWATRNHDVYFNPELELGNALAELVKEGKLSIFTLFTGERKTFFTSPSC